MSFEKPMSLALGPLPLWFLALWANFGCVVLTSFTVKSTDECQECPKVRIWPLPAFFRQSIFSCSELTWSNTQQNALPETNISPLKIGLPKRQLVFQPSIFRCKVSFSEAKKKKRHPRADQRGPQGFRCGHSFFFFPRFHVHFWVLSLDRWHISVVNTLEPWRYMEGGRFESGRREIGGWSLIGILIMVYTGDP